MRMLFSNSVLSVAMFTKDNSNLMLESKKFRKLHHSSKMAVYVNDEPVDYLHFTETSVETEIEAEPYDVVTLRFETNFFVPNAMEQRGTTKLALLLKMTAE